MTRGLDARRSTTLRAALLFAAIVAVTGVRFVDLDDLVALHTHPLRLIEDSRAHYLHASLVSAFLGHALEAVSPRRVQALYLTAALLALAAILLYGHRAIVDPAQRWIFFRLLAISPLIHVLLFWVGKSDPFFVAGYFLLLLSGHPLVVGALSLGMTLTHPEQATVVLAVHTILHRPRPGLLLAHVAGWAGGVGIYQVYLAQLDIAGSPRLAWVVDRFDVLARTNLARPVSMLWLSFSWFWIPVLGYVTTRRDRVVPVLAGGCFVVAALGADFTRIFTVVSLPLAVHVARELACEDGGVLGGWVRMLTALAFLQVELAIGRVWDNGWALMLLRNLGVRLGAP